MEDILQQYDIKKTQILCIVTDNASNMIRTVSELNLEEENEYAYEDDLNLDDIRDNITDNINENISAELIDIQSMRCAAHTLQLAIKDGLKEVEEMLIKVRHIAAKTRLQKSTLF